MSQGETVGYGTRTLEERAVPRLENACCCVRQHITSVPLNFATILLQAASVVVKNLLTREERLYIRRAETSLA
jgi:hypothetical protein